MQALMIVMACSFAAPQVHSSPAAAAEVMSRELETGSLLFSDGKCLAVKLVSRSRYTHVATIVREADGISVYDSQNDVGVRKLTLADYLAATQGDEIEIIHPDESFSATRSQRYQKYLEGQLGRPYAIMHHLTGSRRKGVHCAEYLTDALIRADMITAENPSRVSPASLRKSLLSHDLYEKSKTIAVRVPEPERADGRNWCHKTWLDTKDCCRTCWSGFSGCVLCR